MKPATISKKVNQMNKNQYIKIYKKDTLWLTLEIANNKSDISPSS